VATGPATKVEITTVQVDLEQDLVVEVAVSQEVDPEAIWDRSVAVLETKDPAPEVTIQVAAVVRTSRMVHGIRTEMEIPGEQATHLIPTQTILITAEIILLRGVQLLVRT
jgi:hypothetical protein